MSKQYTSSTVQQDKIKTDIIGVRFGRLVVQSYSHSKPKKSGRGYHYFYNCICDCGKSCIVSRHSLKYNNTKSCGCIRSELLSKRNKESGKWNGDSKQFELLYHSWNRLFNRCYNEKSWDYKYYGGKGVQVCDEWKDWFNFKEWALTNGYEDNLSIDRIDVNGNYEPQNCR